MTKRDMTCAVCELPIDGTWNQDFLTGDIYHDCCMDTGDEPCEHFQPA